MPLVSRIPDTGTEISMGRISKAMGLTATAGSIEVALSYTLGQNRTKLSGSAGQNINIPYQNMIFESNDFGGMSASFTY
jgi:hypothetical protein